MRAGGDDAEGFWRSALNVNTAFLVSSAPRVHSPEGGKVPGFSWAPATPKSQVQPREVIIRDNKKQRYDFKSPTYDGNGSYVGHITPDGLRAVWSYMAFDQHALDQHREDFCDIISPFNDWGSEECGPEDVIAENPDSFNLCNEAQAALKEGKLIRLIQPASADGRSRYQATRNRGDVSGPVAAMIVSDDDGRSWIWHNVYSQLDESYWRWQRDEIVIA